MVKNETIYRLSVCFKVGYYIFGFIMASFSYMKAFKVTKGVAAIIENSSGYNDVSKKLISNYLGGVGYQRYNVTVEKCPYKNGKKADYASDGLCIYNVVSEGTYLTYGIHRI
mgnify:CR=1 FL=1